MADHKRPNDVHKTAPRREMLAKQQCLVKCRVANRLGRECVALILVMTSSWIMIDGDLRVVYQPPSAALHRQRHAQLIPDLSSHTAEARVETHPF